VPPVEADAAGVARFVVGDGDVPVAGTSTCKALVQIFRPPLVEIQLGLNLL
jgi:hypothetical protein